MSPNEWVTLNYDHLRRASTNISSGDSLSEDLLSECLLIFLSKPNVQEIVDSGGAMYYVVRIMVNQWKSHTSPFHKNYRRTVALDTMPEIPDEPSYDSDLEQKIQEELNKINWYSKTLFELHHLKGESISQIARETKIPRTSISVEIKRVKSHLKKIAQEHLSNPH